MAIMRFHLLEIEGVEGGRWVVPLRLCSGSIERCSGGESEFKSVVSMAFYCELLCTVSPGRSGSDALLQHINIALVRSYTSRLAQLCCWNNSGRRKVGLPVEDQAPHLRHNICCLWCVPR